MQEIENAIERADQEAFTREPPKTLQGRINFLLRRLGSAKAVAAELGITADSVNRYRRGARKHPPKDIAARIDRAVRTRWQPRVRGRRRQQAAGTGGITVETRAAFGYRAARGSTDEQAYGSTAEGWGSTSMSSPAATRSRNPAIRTPSRDVAAARAGELPAVTGIAIHGDGPHFVSAHASAVARRIRPPCLDESSARPAPRPAVLRRNTEPPKEVHLPGGAGLPRPQTGGGGRHVMSAVVADFSARIRFDSSIL